MRLLRSCRLNRLRWLLAHWFCKIENIIRIFIRFIFRITVFRKNLEVENIYEMAVEEYPIPLTLLFERKSTADYLSRYLHWVAASVLTPLNSMISNDQMIYHDPHPYRNESVLSSM